MTPAPQENSPEAIPPGEVSTIRGIVQMPALRSASLLALVCAALSLILEGDLSRTLAVVAVALVAATPLLRVMWLIHRLRQERDWRFIGVSVALLCSTAAAFALALALS